MHLDEHVVHDVLCPSTIAATVAEGELECRAGVVAVQTRNRDRGCLLLTRLLAGLRGLAHRAPKIPAATGSDVDSLSSLSIGSDDAPDDDDDDGSGSADSPSFDLGVALDLPSGGPAKCTDTSASALTSFSPSTC